MGEWNVNQRLYSRNITVVVEYIMRQPAGKGVAEERRSATDRHDQEADTRRGRATCRVEERGEADTEGI